MREGGWTSLHVATHGCQTLDAVGEGAWTFLHVAACWVREAVGVRLQQADERVDVEDDEGKTVLRAAAHTRHDAGAAQTL